SWSSGCEGPGSTRSSSCGNSRRLHAGGGADNRKKPDRAAAVSTSDALRCHPRRSLAGCKTCNHAAIRITHPDEIRPPKQHEKVTSPSSDGRRMASGLRAGIRTFHEETSMKRKSILLVALSLFVAGSASARVMDTWTRISLQFTNLARAEASDTGIGVTTLTT